MPVHDWTPVDAGTFHDFHSAWVIHIKEALNGGLLSPGYYARAEQHLGLGIGDILALQRENGLQDSSDPVPIVVAEAPPQVHRRVVLTPTPAARGSRRTLTVRHVSNNRVVALIEIVSPANKDRPRHVDDFVDKAVDALRHDVNLLLIDLFPPGPHDPLGLHGAICERLESIDEPPPADKPLCLAAYCADRFPVAYLEALAASDVLPDMPLFLEMDNYVNVPLEATYQTAYRGLPPFWRDELEGRETPPSA